ncbi:MAG TPA: hypothetical protein DD400_04960 [Rhodospirillaceae bacterium]|nr:hypothetical protein [Rhodospirillaceae bacterium]
MFSSISSIQMFFIGAVLIALSLGSALLVRPASAMGGGPYELMRHSNATANAGVFRVDTTSGNVSYCYLTSGVNLICTKEVK